MNNVVVPIVIFMYLLGHLGSIKNKTWVKIFSYIVRWASKTILIMSEHMSLSTQMGHLLRSAVLYSSAIFFKKLEKIGKCFDILNRRYRNSSPSYVTKVGFIASSLCIY